MAKNPYALVILILLAGNIYFCLKSKKKSAAPKVIGVASPTSTNPASAVSTFKYPAPYFEMASEMNKAKNSHVQLKEYTAKNKYSQQYAFIIDIHIPGYKKRFFV